MAIFLLQRVRLLSTLAANVYFSKWLPPVGMAYTAASRLPFLAKQADGVGLLYVVYTVTRLSAFFQAECMPTLTDQKRIFRDTR